MQINAQIYKNTWVRIWVNHRVQYRDHADHEVCQRGGTGYSELKRIGDDPGYFGIQVDGDAILWLAVSDQIILFVKKLSKFTFLLYNLDYILNLDLILFWAKLA